MNFATHPQDFVCMSQNMSRAALVTPVPALTATTWKEAVLAEPLSTRKPLSKRVRFEVFKRDGFRCSYCGRHPPDVLLEVDHIIPVCEGGDDVDDNLTSACFDCNRGKAGIPLSSVPKSLPEKAAEVAEREEQLAGYRAVMKARADRIDQDAFDVAAILLFKAPGEEFRVDRRWLVSIKKFIGLLPLHEIEEAAELACANAPIGSDYRRFLYFCKVCWNKIKGEGDGQN